MGETKVSFKIYGPDDQVELEAIADTGATFAKIPESTASRLKLKADYEVPVEVGDGRIINRKFVIALAELEGVRRPIPITIGKEREKILLGYTALEILGFRVNPVTGKLEKVIARE